MAALRQLLLEVLRRNADGRDGGLQLVAHIGDELLPGGLKGLLARDIIEGDQHPGHLTEGGEGNGPRPKRPGRPAEAPLGPIALVGPLDGGPTLPLREHPGNGHALAEGSAQAQAALSGGVELLQGARGPEQEDPLLQPGHDARQQAVFPGGPVPQVLVLPLQVGPGPGEVLDGPGLCSPQKLLQGHRERGNLPPGHEHQHQDQGGQQAQDPEQAGSLVHIHPQAQAQEEHAPQAHQGTRHVDRQTRSCPALSPPLIHPPDHTPGTPAGPAQVREFTPLSHSPRR